MTCVYKPTLHQHNCTAEQESLRAAADCRANNFAQYTRDIVKDYEEQTPKQPQTAVRSILRVTLVAVLAIFLLTVLILFFTVGAPAVRTTRH